MKKESIVEQRFRLGKMRHEAPSRRSTRAKAKVNQLGLSEEAARGGVPSGKSKRCTALSKGPTLASFVSIHGGWTVMRPVGPGRIEFKSNANTLH